MSYQYGFSEIVPGLYLSSANAAANENNCVKKKISLIINATTPFLGGTFGPRNYFFKRQASYNFSIEILNFGQNYHPPKKRR